MQPVDSLELRILLTVSAMGGKARYSQLWKTMQKEGENKQTLQNRLSSLKRRRFLKHEKLPGGPLGQSWYTLTSKARKYFGSLGYESWSQVFNQMDETLSSEKIEEEKKAEYLELSLESIWGATCDRAWKLAVMAGLEEDPFARELDTLYVTEHVLGNLVRSMISFLYKNRRYASENLRELAKPVETIEIKAASEPGEG